MKGFFRFGRLRTEIIEFNDLNVTLDGDLLDSENNPFRFNSANLEITSIADCEQFVIIDDSTPDDHINSQSSMYSFPSMNH